MKSKNNLYNNYILLMECTLRKRSSWMPKQTFEVDNERLNEVVMTVTEYWQKYQKSHKSQPPPEVQLLPENIGFGSREHGLFLFMAGCFSLHGKKMAEIMPKVAEVFRSKRHLLCSDISFIEAREDLKDIMPFTEGHPEYIGRWLDNLLRLEKEYQNDPRLIFMGLENGDPMSSRAHLLARLMSFDGIGSKIAQLLIIWFQAVDWDSHKAEWQTLRQIPAVPVDIHSMRLAYQLGIITKYERDYREQIGWPLSCLYSKACLDLRVSWVDFSQGIWKIGSSFCNKARLRTGKKRIEWCLECPVKNLCTGMVPYSKEISRSGKIGYKHFQKHEFM